MMSADGDTTSTSNMGSEATADNACTSNNVNEVTTGQDNGRATGNTQGKRRCNRERGGRGHGRTSTNFKGESTEMNGRVFETQTKKIKKENKSRYIKCVKSVLFYIFQAGC